MNLIVHLFGRELLSIRLAGTVLIADDDDPGDDAEECSLELSQDGGTTTAVLLSTGGVDIVGYLNEQGMTP